MFPLNDSEPNRYSAWPLMTLFIIVVNAVVLCFEWTLPDYALKEMFYLFGSTSHLVLTRQGGGALVSLTSTFLHADFWHWLSNMWALWVFGRRVEDACGAWRFLCYYLVCGLCADAMSSLILYNSHIPSIGASGAIFGVMGAYLILFPGGRIRTLLPLWFIPTFPRIRALWIILYFMVFQIIPAMLILVNGAEYGIGYWAHLGGFFSCFFIFLFLRPEAFAHYWAGEPI